jgi:mRNA-degrading endonuclease RelE of RelBE toxin-antitoxin system
VPYDLKYTVEALDQLRALRATDATRIADQCRTILTVNPTLESRARIKRLVGGVVPSYRMRVDEYRVFYSVEEEPKRVVVWGIVSKAEAWLTEKQQEARDANENAPGSAEPPARTGRRGAPTPSD